MLQIYIKYLRDFAILFMVDSVSQVKPIHILSENLQLPFVTLVEE